ncbi:ParA family protein [Sneathiella marina]|uniref:ParA family protein n=1 Tax=Sneathiella marina TaxID=2950108 RepID=A0ABY4VYZ4_9PROT|nr:ParA family protein [Sneathiella marina]USG59851.1 ParA family protein [Sneathiella marina]
MKVIAVASQKGGSGKTTLAGHLAVQAEMAGQGPVALVDTDPQGSLSEWWNEREAETPLFARTTVERLSADIGRMEQMGIGLLIVDTPPAITSTIANVIGLADLLIIPTRPSPHDLRAVGATVELAEGLNTPLIFVVNGATPRARITSEAAIALSQHGTLAPSVIHQRVDFASSMIDGRTTMELNPSSKSSEEISKLWSYVQERVARLSPAYPASPNHGMAATAGNNGAIYN